MSDIMQLNLPVLNLLQGNQSLGEFKNSAKQEGEQLDFMSLLAGLMANFPPGLIGQEVNSGPELPAVPTAAVETAAAMAVPLPGVERQDSGKQALRENTGFAAVLEADTGQGVAENGVTGSNWQLQARLPELDAAVLPAAEAPAAAKASSATETGAKHVNLKAFVPAENLLLKAELPGKTMQDGNLVPLQGLQEESITAVDNLLGKETRFSFDPAGQLSKIPLPQQVQESVFKESFQSIAEQLIQSSKANLANGKSEIEIQLKPEYLGKVHLHVALEEGVLTAKFAVDNQNVGRLLESNINQLRQALQEHGLKFGQLQVEVGNGSLQQQFSQQYPSGRQHYGPAQAGEQHGETVSVNLGAATGVNFLA